MTTITIFHKDYCPYCRNAKQILKAYGLTYQAIEVSNNPAEFAKMLARSGRRTVPQIFFGDTHIGGHDDLLQHIRNNNGINLGNDQLVIKKSG